jgi:hypothetical protein
MVPRSLSKQELEWRAQDDARVLKAYAEIQSDQQRLDAATKVLEEEAKKIASVLDTTKANGII